MISFKLDVMIESTKLHFDYSLDDFDLHLILMKYNVLPKPVGFVKFVSDLCCTINMQKRGLYVHDFTKYILNIGLHLDSVNQFV